MEESNQACPAASPGYPASRRSQGRGGGGSSRHNGSRTNSRKCRQKILHCTATDT